MSDLIVPFFLVFVIQRKPTVNDAKSFVGRQPEHSAREAVIRGDMDVQPYEVPATKSIRYPRGRRFVGNVAARTVLRRSSPVFQPVGRLTDCPPWCMHAKLLEGVVEPTGL